MKIPNKPQNLEERLNSFFIRNIRLCKKCTLNARTSRIISQLTGCAGSLPANYSEATEAMSKKDFVKSIKIARKESKESRVWLRGLKEVVDFENSKFDALIQEASEFIYIFTSILKKADV
jgi:four helix bundle protein